MIIELNEHVGRVYAGRPNGEGFRDYYKINEVEGAIIKFPHDTKMITSAWLEGFLGGVMIRYTCSEDFRLHFALVAPAGHVVRLSEIIENFYEKKRSQ